MARQLESKNTDQDCAGERSGRRDSDQTGASRGVKRGVSGNSSRIAPL